MTARGVEQPCRYFFVHLMKTAGVALRERLMNHFGKAAVYPTGGLDGNDWVTLFISIDLLRERLEARGDEIRVIAGHFPLRTAELIDGRLTTLTLLRDPVERMLSYLRQRREKDEHRRLNAHEEIYDDHLGRADNYMTKMLTLTPAEMSASMFTRVEMDRDHLERAKEALAGIDAVGFQEHFEDFCEELTARFGWQLGEPKVVNTTTPVEIPDSLRARIAEDNALDIELYEFAEQLVATRGRQRGPERARVKQ
jgi:hypothetical protein